MSNVFSKLSFVVLAVFFISSPAVSSEIEAIKPAYKGDVFVINDPVFVQYKPYTKSALSNNSTTVVTMAGTNMETISNTVGTSEIISKDDHLEMLISIEKVEAFVGGKKQQDIGDMQMVLSMTPYGKFLGFDLTSKSLPANDLAATKGLMQGFIKQLISELPREGIKTGYKFETDVNLGFGVLNFVGTVWGQTTYNNRPSLVVDIGQSSFEVNLEGQTIKGSVRGYGLMDIATGAWTYNETAMSLPIGANPGDGAAIHQVVTIDLK